MKEMGVGKKKLVKTQRAWVFRKKVNNSPRKRGRGLRGRRLLKKGEKENSLGTGSGAYGEWK